MSPRPLVSVVIACLNAEATLGAQLDALAAAPAGFPWELLLVDNGSEDGSVALAESYADRIPRLRVIHAGQRRGVSVARNTGARLAEGRYLAFCDADDVVADGWLPAMAEALYHHPFVAGPFEGERLNDRRTVRSRPVAQTQGLQESPIGPGLPHAGAGNMGVERSIFLAVGGFDETLACLEDTDLCWRVQLAGVPLSWAPRVRIHMRLRNSLRGMFRQGRAYGAAFAELERRYPPQAYRTLGVDAAPIATQIAWRSEEVHERVADLVTTGSLAIAPAGRLETPASVRRAPTRAVRTTPTGELSIVALDPDDSPGTRHVSRWDLGHLLWQAGWHVGHRLHHPR